MYIYVYIFIYILVRAAAALPPPPPSAFRLYFCVAGAGPQPAPPSGSFHFFFCLFIFRLTYFRVLVQPLFLNTTAPRAVQRDPPSPPTGPKRAPRLLGEPRRGRAGLRRGEARRCPSPAPPRRRAGLPPTRRGHGGEPGGGRAAAGKAGPGPGWAGLGGRRGLGAGRSASPCPLRAPLRAPFGAPLGREGAPRAPRSPRGSAGPEACGAEGCPPPRELPHLVCQQRSSLWAKLKNSFVVLALNIGVLCL